MPAVQAADGVQQGQGGRSARAPEEGTRGGEVNIFLLLSRTVLPSPEALRTKKVEFLSLL